MKIKPPIDDHVGFQMAPMIDIVFLLIIFFIVAAKQSQAQYIEIEQPIAEHAKVPEQQGNRGVVTIRADETIYIGNKVASIEDVTEMAKDRADEKKFRVFIRAHRDVKHGEVRKVMKAVADGGVLDILFSSYESE